MFRNIHRHPTFFPIVIVLLTGILIYFMFFSFTSKPIVLSPTTPVVNEEEYREAVKKIIAPFSASVSSAPNDMAKLVLVENTLNSLLGVTVPALYKDAHFEMAVGLNQMREGLRGAKGVFEEGKSRLARVVEANPWMK